MGAAFDPVNSAIGAFDLDENRSIGRVVQFDVGTPTSVVDRAVTNDKLIRAI